MADRRRFGGTSLAACLLWALGAAGLASAQAGIVFDGSAGAAGPADYDAATRTYTIPQDRGTLSPDGGLLIHSMSAFRVDVGETANLTGAASIDTVLARNTGVDKLTLLGTFRSSIPNADVLLVSPTGIVTGSGTQIDVPGSFYLSGASHVRLADGTIIDATSAAPLPLLSSALPVAFGFGADSGDVTINGSRVLAVTPGERLSLTGKRVLGNGVSSIGTNLGAAGNDVQLGAATGGELPLDLATLDPAVAGGPDLGQVALISEFGVDVSSAGSAVASGRVVIRGSRLTLQNSSIRSANQTGSDALGDVDIRASERIDLRDGMTITALSSSSSMARGANVHLEAPDIALQGGSHGDSRVEIRSSGSGAAGDLRIAAERLDLFDESSLVTAASDDASGLAGTIDVRAREHLILHDDAIIQSLSEGAAEGGAVLIGESASIRILDRASIQTVASGTATGGEVHLRDSGDLEVVQNGRILSYAEATANGGGIRVSATDHIRISDGGSVLSINDGSGTGGRILIGGATPSVAVLDGGRIRSEALDSGQGGRISITTGEMRIAKLGSDARATDVSTSTRSVAYGDARGGDLEIFAQSVQLEGGGQIAVDSEGLSRQGNLKIDAATFLESVGLDDFGRPSGLFSRAGELTISPSGTAPPLLDVDAHDLSLFDGAEISASTFGTAEGANIDIDVTGTVTVGRAGGRFALVSSSSLGPGAGGAGGRVEVNAQRVVLRGGGEIVSDTFGAGAAGSVFIEADEIDLAGRDVAGVRSRISSESKSTTLLVAGDAGSIELLARRSLQIDDGAAISVASAGAAGGGSIDITAGRSVVMRDGAEIRASADGSSDAGTIRIDAGERFESDRADVITRAAAKGGGQVEITAVELVSLREATIDAQVQAGGGDGGNVTIDPRVVVLNDSDIIANAVDGNGGNISIRGAQFLRSAGSRLDATSRTGIQGNVVTTTPDSELPSDLASIERPFLDASDLMLASCDLRSERSGSFTVVASRAARGHGDDLLDPALLGDRPPSVAASGSCEDPAGGGSRDLEVQYE